MPPTWIKTAESCAGLSAAAKCRVFLALLQEMGGILGDAEHPHLSITQVDLDDEKTYPMRIMQSIAVKDININLIV